MDKKLWPERSYPEHWRTPAGIMAKAPRGKVVVTNYARRPAPPRGTNWQPSAEGDIMVASPREPLVVIRPEYLQRQRPLSSRFEGWSR